MSPNIALPRGSSTGLRTALESHRGGAASYIYADPAVASFDLSTLQDNANAPLIMNGDERSGRHVGLRVGCAGLSADGVTALVRVLLVKKVQDYRGPANPSTDKYVLLPYCAITFTAGTMTLGTGNHIADTAVISLDDYGTHMEARTSARAASAYSPANNQMALVQIPDIDNCDGIILDTQISGGGASTTVNPLYEFTT